MDCFICESNFQSENSFPSGDSSLSQIRSKTRQCIYQLEANRSRSPLYVNTFAEAGKQPSLEYLRAVSRLYPIITTGDQDYIINYDQYDRYVNDTGSAGYVTPCNTPRVEILTSNEPSDRTGLQIDQKENMGGSQNRTFVAEQEHKSYNPKCIFDMNSLCSEKHLPSRSFAALKQNFPVSKRLPKNKNVHTSERHQRKDLDFGGLLTTRKLNLQRPQRAPFWRSDNNFRKEDLSVATSSTNTNMTSTRISTDLQENQINHSAAIEKRLSKDDLRYCDILDSLPRNCFENVTDSFKSASPKHMDEKPSNVLLTASLCNKDVLNDVTKENSDVSTKNVVTNEIPERDDAVPTYSTITSNLMCGSNPSTDLSLSDFDTREQDICKNGVKRTKITKKQKKCMKKHRLTRHGSGGNRFKNSKYKSGHLRLKIKPRRVSKPSTMSWLYRSLTKKSRSLLKNENCNNDVKVKNRKSKRFHRAAKRKKRRRKTHLGTFSREHRVVSASTASPYENIRTIKWEKCLNVKEESSSKRTNEKINPNAGLEPETEMCVDAFSSENICETSADKSLSTNSLINNSKNAEDDNTPSLSTNCLSNNSKNAEEKNTPSLSTNCLSNNSKNAEDDNTPSLSTNCLSNNSKNAEEKNTPSLPMNYLRDNRKMSEEREKNIVQAKPGSQGKVESQTKVKLGDMRNKRTSKKCQKDIMFFSDTKLLSAPKVTLKLPVSARANYSTGKHKSSHEYNTRNLSKSQSLCSMLNGSQSVSSLSSKFSAPDRASHENHGSSYNFGKRPRRKTSLRPSCAATSVTSRQEKDGKKLIRSSQSKEEQKVSNSKQNLGAKTKAVKCDRKNDNEEKNNSYRDRSKARLSQTDSLEAEINDLSQIDSLETEINDMSLVEDSSVISLVMENFDEEEIQLVLGMLKQRDSSCSQNGMEGEELNSQTKDMRIEDHKKLIDCIKWFIRNNDIVIEQLDRAIESVDIELEEPCLEWPLPNTQELNTEFPSSITESPDKTEIANKSQPLDNKTLSQNQQALAAKRPITPPYENNESKKAKAVVKNVKVVHKQIGAVGMKNDLVSDIKIDTSKNDVEEKSNRKQKMVGKAATKNGLTHSVNKKTKSTDKETNSSDTQTDNSEISIQIKTNATKKVRRYSTSVNHCQKRNLNSVSSSSLPTNFTISCGVKYSSQSKEKNAQTTPVTKKGNGLCNRTSSVFQDASTSNSTFVKKVISRGNKKSEIEKKHQEINKRNIQCQQDESSNLSVGKLKAKLPCIEVNESSKFDPAVHHESSLNSLDSAYTKTKSNCGEGNKDPKENKMKNCSKRNQEIKVLQTHCHQEQGRNLNLKKPVKRASNIDVFKRPKSDTSASFKSSWHSLYSINTDTTSNFGEGNLGLVENKINGFTKKNQDIKKQNMQHQENVNVNLNLEKLEITSSASYKSSRSSLDSVYTETRSNAGGEKVDRKQNKINYFKKENQEIEKQNLQCQEGVGMNLNAKLGITPSTSVNYKSNWHRLESINKEKKSNSGKGNIDPNQEIKKQDMQHQQDEGSNFNSRELVLAVSCIGLYEKPNPKPSVNYERSCHSLHSVYAETVTDSGDSEQNLFLLQKPKPTDCIAFHHTLNTCERNERMSSLCGERISENRNKILNQTAYSVVPKADCNIPVPSLLPISVDQPLAKTSFESRSMLLPRLIDDSGSRSMSVSSEELSDKDQETRTDCDISGYNYSQNYLVGNSNSAKKQSWAEHLGCRNLFNMDTGLQSSTSDLENDSRNLEAESLQEVYTPWALEFCQSPDNNVTQLPRPPLSTYEPPLDDILLTGKAMPMNNRQKSSKSKMQMVSGRRKPRSAANYPFARRIGPSTFTRSTTASLRKAPTSRVWSHMRGCGQDVNHSFILSLKSRAKELLDSKAKQHKGELPGLGKTTARVSARCPHVKNISLEGFDCGRPNGKFDLMRGNSYSNWRKTTGRSNLSRDYMNQSSFKVFNPHVKKRIPLVQTVDNGKVTRGFPFSHLYSKDLGGKANCSSDSSEVVDDLQNSKDSKTKPVEKLSFLKEILAIDKCVNPRWK